MKWIVVATLVFVSPNHPTDSESINVERLAKEYATKAECDEVKDAAIRDFLSRVDPRPGVRINIKKIECVEK